MENFFKKLSLGKVAYSGNTKRNLLEIEVRIQWKHRLVNDVWMNPVTEMYPVLTMSGGIWNSNKSDYDICGQMLDEILKLYKANFKNVVKIEALTTLVKIWERWHLNDLKSKNALNLYDKETFDRLFEERTNRLVDFHKDSYYNKLQKYETGSQWLLEALPNEVIEEVKKLCEILEK